LQRQVDQSAPNRRSDRLLEELSEPLTMSLIEPPQRVVVRTLSRSQPQKGDLFATGGLKLSAGTYGRHESIQPDRQQHLRGECWAPLHRTLWLHSQRQPLVSLQVVHQRRNEPRRMIRWQPFVNARWQQKLLLATKRA